MYSCALYLLPRPLKRTDKRRSLTRNILVTCWRMSELSYAEPELIWTGSALG